MRVETKFGGFMQVPAPTGAAGAAGAATSSWRGEHSRVSPPQGGTEAAAWAVADDNTNPAYDARAEEENRAMRQQILELEKQLQEMRAQ